MLSKRCFFMHWTQIQPRQGGSKTRHPQQRTLALCFFCFPRGMSLCLNCHCVQNLSRWNTLSAYLHAESIWKRFLIRPLLRLPLYAVYFPSERSITSHGVITQCKESKPSTGLKLPLSLSVPLLLLSICSEHRSRFPRASCPSAWHAFVWLIIAPRIVQTPLAV